VSEEVTWVRLELSTLESAKKKGATTTGKTDARDAAAASNAREPTRKPRARTDDDRRATTPRKEMQK